MSSIHAIDFSADPVRHRHRDILPRDMWCATGYVGFPMMERFLGVYGLRHLQVNYDPCTALCQVRKSEVSVFTGAEPDLAKKARKSGMTCPEHPEKSARLLLK